MYILFGGGVIPGSHRRQLRSANLRGTGAPSTTHLENDEDDEVDDFMPPMPCHSSSNTGEGSMIIVREHSHTISRWRTTDKEIRPAITVIAQDDDGDDFMPQQPLPPRPPSSENIGDPENDDGFAGTHPYNFPLPPQR